MYFSSFKRWLLNKLNQQAMSVKDIFTKVGYIHIDLQYKSVVLTHPVGSANL